MVYLEEDLKVGVSYFWRVDGEREDGTVVRLVTGDVWEFITI